MKPYHRMTGKEVEISDKEARRLLKQGTPVWGLENGCDWFATRVTKVGTKYITTISGEEIYTEFMRLFKTITSDVDAHSAGSYIGYISQSNGAKTNDYSTSQPVHHRYTNRTNQER